MDTVAIPLWIVAILLAINALVIVAAQIAFLLPELTAAQPFARMDNEGSTLHLFDSNVYNENPSMAGYAVRPNG